MNGFQGETQNKSVRSATVSNSFHRKTYYSCVKKTKRETKNFKIMTFIYGQSWSWFMKWMLMCNSLSHKFQRQALRSLTKVLALMDLKCIIGNLQCCSVIVLWASPLSISNPPDIFCKVSAVSADKLTWQRDTGSYAPIVFVDPTEESWYHCLKNLNSELITELSLNWLSQCCRGRTHLVNTSNIRY